MTRLTTHTYSDILSLSSKDTPSVAFGHTISTAPMAFRSLPLELNEGIATLLDSDADLCNFTMICHETHNAVHSRRAAVWRTRFAKKYDLRPGQTGQDIMLQYMNRSMTLAKATRHGFRKGRSEPEVKCLEVLRDLIIESYASASKMQSHPPRSNNLDQLLLFVKASNILDHLLFNVHRSDMQSRLLQTVQVVLAHLHLDLSIRTRIRGFGCSQQAVYNHPSKAPLFVDKRGTINMEHLLHIINFFKYHMKTETENTLYPLLHDLDDWERPGAWQAAISDQPSLKLPGLDWKGSYAYIPEMGDLEDIRCRDPLGACQDVPIPDAIDYEDGFQTLELDPLPPPSTTQWPAAFEQHLHALPTQQVLNQLPHQPAKHGEQSGSFSPRRSGRGAHRDRRVCSSFSWDNLLPDDDTASLPCKFNSTSSRIKGKETPKPGQDYILFTGAGRDLNPYQASGIIHSLPNQCGIPGWQRMCMMKYGASLTSPAPSHSPQSSFSSAPSTPTSSVAFSAPSSISSMSSNDQGGPITPLLNPSSWSGGTDSDDLVIVDDECWCYEGVILPGGKITLGRWWHPLDETDFTSTGPFLFWNTGQAPNTGGA